MSNIKSFPIGSTVIGAAFKTRRGYLLGNHMNVAAAIGVEFIELEVVKAGNNVIMTDAEERIWYYDERSDSVLMHQDNISIDVPYQVKPVTDILEKCFSKGDDLDEIQVQQLGMIRENFVQKFPSLALVTKRDEAGVRRFVVTPRQFM